MKLRSIHTNNVYWLFIQSKLRLKDVHFFCQFYFTSQIPNIKAYCKNATNLFNHSHVNLKCRTWGEKNQFTITACPRERDKRQGNVCAGLKLGEHRWNKSGMKAQPSHGSGRKTKEVRCRKYFVAFAGRVRWYDGFVVVVSSNLNLRIPEGVESEWWLLMRIGSLCSEIVGGRRRGGGHPLGITPELSVTCSAESETNATATVYN